MSILEAHAFQKGIKSGPVFSTLAPMSKTEGAFWCSNGAFGKRFGVDTYGKGPRGSKPTGGRASFYLGLWSFEALGLWECEALGRWGSGPWGSGALGLWGSGALGLCGSGALRLWGPEALRLWGSERLWGSGAGWLAGWRSVGLRGFLEPSAENTGAARCSQGGVLASKVALCSQHRRQ